MVLDILCKKSESINVLAYGCHSVVLSLKILSASFMVASQAYSSPKEDPELSKEEKKLIMGGSISKEPVKVIPWRLILSKAPVWALIISHFCHNWGTFILLTWMPTYYNQVFKTCFNEQCLLTNVIFFYL